MSEPRPLPYFEVPYPDPPILFDALPQSVRDAWVSYAKANPIGYLDYKRIIRETGDAYLFVLQMDMACNAGDTSLLYPPEFSPPQAQQLASAWADVTTQDIVALPTSRDIPADTTILVWATAPAAAPEDINGRLNKFIGAFTLPAGTPAKSIIADIGAGYVTAFGTLAAEVGKYVVLWAFACTNGSIRYLGAWTAQVKVPATLKTQAYWPLNETFDPRRSIAKAANLTDVGIVGGVGGIIDGAARFNTPGPQYLRFDDAARFSPNGADFSLSLWFNPLSVATDQILVMKGNDFDTLDMEWALQYWTTPNKFEFWIFDGIANNGVQAALPTPAVAGTWYHIVCRNTPDGARATIAINAVQQGVAVARWVPPPTTAPLYIGSNAGINQQTRGDICELTYLERFISPDEITALYNAGAGNRFPYA